MLRNCSISLVVDLIADSVVLFVNVFGLIGNGLCIVVFSKILLKTQTQGNLFRFLLLKSIADFSYFISNFWSLFYYCTICNMFKFFIFQIWYIWFYYYFQYFGCTISSVFEVAATFDCLITINKTFIFCQKKLFFYSFSFFVLIFLVLFYLIYPFGYKIEKKTNFIDNMTTSFYDNEFNQFGSSFFYKNVVLIDSMVRDGLFLLILIILNGFILNLLKKSTQRRRALVGNNRNNDNTLLTSQNAERRRMKMIIATGLNYMIGHSIFLTENIISISKKQFDVFCSFRFLIFFYDFYYADSIILYFLFNNIFKKFLIELIPFNKRNNQINNINQ
jgi:hypothetical protein